MNLKKKKKLIARVLKVGIKRVRLNSDMKEEIKEAITRQDIKDLKKENIVQIKGKTGKRKRKKRKTKKGVGKKRKKVKKKKQDYVKLVRKLRTYIKRLKDKGKLSREEYYNLRKKIKTKDFKDFSQLKKLIQK